MNPIYPILSGMLAQERRLEVISNNIANLGTPAYKRDFVLFSGFSPVKREAIDIPPVEATPTFGMIDDVITDFSIGPIQVTGEPLDLAIDGTGFFAIETPQGTRYTRSGNFTLDPEGKIVTPSGFPLLGEGGSIITPPEAESINIDSTGKVVARTSAGLLEVGLIPIYEFAVQERLKKIGNNFYDAVDQQATVSLTAAIRSGSLERANVNAPEELVAMIMASRLYETSQRVIRSADEMLGYAVNEVGRL